MADIREELVHAALIRAKVLTNYNIQNNKEKEYEFRKQTITGDEYLTNDEKLEAIRMLTEDFDFIKLRDNEGTTRICENCQLECLATLYCEHCVRNYLKTKFSNWTSGNDDIDDIIKKCQMETTNPTWVVEWIPYNKLKNVKYLTKGGCSEIYSADWIDGSYDEWDSKEKQLKRSGEHKVILKRLENVENANRHWFDEGKSHMIISNKYSAIVPCHGLTKDPSDGNYILVMSKMDMNLREYLQQNHKKLTWNVRIQIVDMIVDALYAIHDRNNVIHRDLHSGNILYDVTTQAFVISDLGFCGPADKPLNSIYGNLPYIAPEVIAGKQTTFASDIYSIGMLMWEISSGEPPFACFDHNYDLAMKIINGMRPKIVPGTPLEYLELMEQCWDADPTKRPNTDDLLDDIQDINRLYQQNKEQINFNSNINDLQLNKNFNISSNSFNSLVRNFNSKIYNFKDMPEPRNATKEEQEAYHSKQNDLSIPYNILFENQTDEQNNSIMIVDNNEVKGKFKRIRPNNSDDEKNEDVNVYSSKKVKFDNDKEICAQSTYNNNIEFQYVQRNYDISDDDDETYNNPNLHSDDQEDLEIPED